MWKDDTTCYHGVGIVINYELRNYITGVETIDDYYDYDLLLLLLLLLL